MPRRRNTTTSLPPEGTTTSRVPSLAASLASPPPPPLEIPPAPTWSLSRVKGKMVLAVKTEGQRPALLYLTSREAVRLASHLLANCDGIMQEEELNRGLPF